MALLQNIGAVDFSIRTYFSTKFTSKQTWYGRIQTSYPDVSTLKYSGFTSKHIELTPRASYRLLPGGEKNNFSN